MLGEALQQTEESGIAALEERLARRGESSSLAEAETALTSLLHKLSLKHVRAPSPCCMRHLLICHAVGQS